MKKELNNLFKTDDGNGKIVATTPQKLKNSKRRINGICDSLVKTTKEYRPEKTIASIEKYIEDSEKLDRILYSEISNYMFSLEENVRGTFVSNAEKLLSFVYTEGNECSPDCRKIVTKIYDHSQLALHQIENATNILASGIENTRENMKSELQENIRGIEKEYISILGIFAAIILAFVGGITFSSSILENMHRVSIYRLLLTVDFLAVVLINTIYLLIHFVFKINEREIKFFNIKMLNIAFALIAVVIVISWFMDVISLREFIGKWFPWC